MKSIFICIPTIDNKINTKCMLSLIKLLEILKNYNFEPSISIKQGSHINRLRNEFIGEFIYRKKDYILFIDSDIGDYEGAVINMIHADKDIIGCLYPKKGLDLNLICLSGGFNSSTYFNVNLRKSLKDTENEIINKNGLLKVKHLGAGCLLIKSDVIKLLIHEYPDKKYNAENKPFDIYNFFDSYIYEGKYLTEDYGFCQLALDNNFSIYALTSINITHTGEFKYTGNFYDFIKKIKLKYKI